MLGEGRSFFRALRPTCSHLISSHSCQGVALSAQNMVSNAFQVNEMEDLGEYSLGLLPFFHIYGMLLINLSIYQGKTKVILPRFEPHSFLNVLSKYKVRISRGAGSGMRSHSP